MEILGLIFEFIFLAFGVYIYLFAYGKIDITTHKNPEQAEAFRKKNAGWLRLLSLALIAVMSLEIFLHIRDLING